MFEHTENTIAVTIGVGSRVYRLMARYAAESCAAATGLPTYIIGDWVFRKMRDLGRPHRLKFRLFDLFPNAKTIVYFDADTVFLKTLALDVLVDGQKLGCVLDEENDWSRKDSALLGVPKKEYFNSGFLILHRLHHHELLWLAESYFRSGMRSALHDQGYLNLARWTLKTPTQFLSRDFNVIDFVPSKLTSDSVVGHFNGSAERTASEIHRRYAKWSPWFCKQSLLKSWRQNPWIMRVSA